MIPVYKPYLTDLEREYARKAIESGWISSSGEYIEKFENSFANYVGTKYAVSLVNGSAACHLCVLCSDIGDGEVLVPNLTYVATPNAVVQAGAIPVFGDVNPLTWNIDFILNEELITKKTRAIFAVHLLGNPVNCRHLNSVAQRYGILIIEDACESLGASYGERKTGNFGLCAAFSLFGNKTISAGQGGMLVTNDENIYKKALSYRNHAHTGNYYHSGFGFNYCMTNIQAAIGLAQLERIDEILARKKIVYEQYGRKLKFGMQFVPTKHTHGYWMTGVSVDDVKEVRAKLAKQEIESRPMFVPMTDLPMYKDHKKSTTENYRTLYDNVVILPSYPELTEEQVDLISSIVEPHVLGRI